jgi:hypothetical protein
MVRARTDVYIAVRTKFSTHVLYLRVSVTYFLKSEKTLASSCTYIYFGVINCSSSSCTIKFNLCQ